MKIHHKILAISLLMSAPISSSHAAESQGKEIQNIKTSVARLWSSFDAVNMTSFKSVCAFPVSFVEITPTRAQTNFIQTEQEFDEEVTKKAKTKFVQVPLNARLSQFKIQMINQKLASVTYKMYIPQRKVSSRVFAAQTLSMQTLLKKDKSWKIMFSTIPYEM